MVDRAAYVGSMPVPRPSRWSDKAAVCNGSWFMVCRSLDSLRPPRSRPKRAEISRVDIEELEDAIASAAARTGQPTCQFFVVRNMLHNGRLPLRLLLTWDGGSWPSAAPSPYGLAPWYEMDNRQTDRARMAIKKQFRNALVHGQIPSPPAYTQSFLILFQAVADRCWRSRAVSGGWSGPIMQREFLLTYQLSQNWDELLRRHKTAICALLPEHRCLSHSVADRINIDIPDVRNRHRLGRM